MLVRVRRSAKPTVRVRDIHIASSEYVIAVDDNNNTSTYIIVVDPNRIFWKNYMYVPTVYSYTRRLYSYCTSSITSFEKYASRKQNLLLEAIEKQNHL